MSSVNLSRQLGRYELIAQIASGGMGTVLLARLAGAGGFQRLFAIKLLHSQYVSDEEFVQMLLDEARIAARIHHPNVVAIHEVGESEEHGYYLVMDYVEGFPLWDIGYHLGKPSPARWRVINRVILDALNGLEAAHTLTDDDGQPLHVVHRDVSPQNILVGVDGIARVTDFGIAKAAARITSTRAGQVKGKLAYMSPEQARGKGIDRRTDVFAAGIVLWEMFTTQRLFKRRTEAETFEALLYGRIRPLREVIPSVPVALEAVCARALERDPERRFHSAREFARALEDAARASNLLADAHEIGTWMRTTFAEPLRQRREAIRAAATSHAAPSEQKVTQLPSGLQVPTLPEHSIRLAAPMETPRADGSSMALEWEDLHDTVADSGPAALTMMASALVSSSASDDGDGELDHDLDGPTRSIETVKGPEVLRNVAGRKEKESVRHGDFVRAAPSEVSPGHREGLPGTVSSAASSPAAHARPHDPTGPMRAQNATTAAAVLEARASDTVASVSVTPSPVTPEVIAPGENKHSRSRRVLLLALIAVGVVAAGTVVTIGLWQYRSNTVERRVVRTQRTESTVVSSPATVPMATPVTTPSLAFPAPSVTATSPDATTMNTPARPPTDAPAMDVRNRTPRRDTRTKRLVEDPPF